MTNPDDYFFNVFNVIDSCSQSFIRARNLFGKKKRKAKTKESVLSGWNRSFPWNPLIMCIHDYEIMAVASHMGY